LKIVGLFGSKGGTGKSTLSHLLALGCALHGKPGLVVHTDAREPERHHGRPYHYLNGRDPRRLYAALERAKAASDGIAVIDGGGNRAGIAGILAQACDLVLIPCGIGGQDATMALADLEALPGAWIVVNKWPMLPKHPRRPKAEAYIAALPVDRILCRLGESAAADRLTESDTEEHPWGALPARVTHAARLFYSAVSYRLKES
jgi:hypothetical protein